MDVVCQTRCQIMRKTWQKWLPKLVGQALNIAGIFAPRKTVELSMRVFAKPRKGRVLSHQRKFLQKAIPSPISVNGQDFHVHIFGHGGEAILLAHGWESNSWRWRKLMRHLGTEKFKFIALDAPGHGMTPSEYFNVHGYAEAIAATARTYQCHTVIGHSIGGFACMYAAALNTQAGITKIVSLAAPSSLQLIMEKYFSIIGLSKYMQSRTFALFPKLYGQTIESLDVQNFGRNITATGLIIHDQSDAINGPESAYQIHECWPGSKLEITVDSDHSLQNDFVFERIKAFISA